VRGALKALPAIMAAQRALPAPVRIAAGTGLPVRWLDPRLASSFVLNSGHVVAWSARIGTCTVVQGSAPLQPAWSATGLNGKPGVQFTAANLQTLDEYPSTVAAASTVASSSKWTMAAVASHTVDTTTSLINYAKGSVTSGVHCRVGRVSSDIAYARKGSNTFNGVSNVAINTTYTFGAEFDGTNLRLLLNGALENSGASPSSQIGCDKLTLGALWFNSAYSSYFTGFLGDVVLIPGTALSVDYPLYASLLNAWLAARYA
jgi:hypothetical protein